MRTERTFWVREGAFQGSSDKVLDAGAVIPDIASEALVGRYMHRFAPALIWVITAPLGADAAMRRGVLTPF